MVLAAHPGTLYPGAQLDSGLRHVDVATAAGLDILLLPGSAQSLSPHWRFLPWLCWSWWSGLRWHREVVAGRHAARFGAS